MLWPWGNNWTTHLFIFADRNFGDWCGDKQFETYIPHYNKRYMGIQIVWTYDYRQTMAELSSAKHGSAELVSEFSEFVVTAA